MASSSSSASVEVEGFPEGMDGGLVGVEEGALVLELEPMAGPESAAAKKKRKKKEREREKKAAAAAAAASTSREMEDDKENKDTRRPEKKVPKHVREMQEALARRKEAEERANQEREERTRKEEEEHRRQDELLRLAEEVRMRKKEREREKILKKKEAGLPVTAKQKEKQARIEAFRNQILADSGVKLTSRSSSDDGAATKRPVYSTKKKGSKLNHGVNNGIEAPNVWDEEEDVQVATVSAEEVESVAESSGSAAASSLSRPTAENVPQVCMVNLEETSGASDKSKQNAVGEVEDEEKWDAKSWDQDTSLPLAVKMAAFDDEDDDSLGRLSLETEVRRAPLRVLHGTSLPPPSAADARKAISSQLATGMKHSGSGAAMDGEVKLRSPICCIMGHVDAGKTKLLDCIRGSNIQEGEAGGITQQIGATYLPAENIRERTSSLKADAKLNVPGLLVIDTPGHASFANLRSRGSGLCDIAVLVVDIKRGLERQTIESLNLLKNRNTEFIVALNKVDRLYGWKRYRNTPIAKSLKQQAKDVKNEFNEQLTKIITQFKEQGINTELYSKNREMGETFNIVPTSAVSGDGIPELLFLVAQRAQKTMVEKLTFSNKVQCTVLEVKVIEGHGTTIDVVLVNGVLCKGDRIVCCGLQGPIVTTIRALLTPHPMKELRVKGTYMHHMEVRAAQGIKITAQGLEHVIGGSGLYVVRPYDDLEEIKEMCRKDMNSVLNRIDRKGEGVFVQASTLGSLEALLNMLEQPDAKIPVGGISLGPVNKKDVVRASTMVEKKREYAAILAFDVKVAPEAKKYADEVGVKIFMADVIYHLFDQFKAYVDQLNEEKKRETAVDAVVPCVLEILPECVFNKKDPILVGVVVLEGTVKVGTPMCIPSKDFMAIGRISSIRLGQRTVDSATKGQEVAIKIVADNPEQQQRMYGRHFDHNDELVSFISRQSIDAFKAIYGDDNAEWKLLLKLCKLFNKQDRYIQ